MARVTEYNVQQAHDDELLESICVAAIVKIVDFDPKDMTVDVQPLSKHLVEDGVYESQPQILGVPVACTKCGGFITRPWIKKGDVGLVVYLDHDIDSVLSGGKEAEPQTDRTHSTSDAVFIGGVVAGGFHVKGLPEKSLSLATEDGSTYVAVTKDKILIKGDVHVTGKITSTG